MSYDKVALEFQPEALEVIADNALELEIGARGLRSVMERIMTKIMYEVPSDSKIEKVIITKECAAGLEPPWIVHKPKPQIDPDAS
jgi:ATP-dependent Clp protease ATP-binding subunit ClpX